MSRAFVRLDVSDLAGRDEYERAFYEAFSRVTTNRLVRQLWHWDDDRRRLKIRLGYEDHAIFVSRRAGGELHLAIAAHQDPARAQSAAYGFAIPCESGIFEVLTFFTTSPSAFPGMRGFWRRFLAQMRQAGLTRGYATCAAPLLPLYQHAGWEVADETEINGEVRYLLTLRLDAGPAMKILNNGEFGIGRGERNRLAVG